jgi:hypothetical protein
MPALRQKAELIQACISVLIGSEFGHKRSFEQTNKRSECACIVKIIASIEDPLVINKILAQFNDKVASAETRVLTECRTPPAMGLFD